MRLFLVFAVLALLAPFAAAGPSGGAGALDETNRCSGSYGGDSYGNSTPDGGWWWHSWYQSDESCKDKLSYAHASASDANGEVASVSVDTWNGNESRHAGWNDQEWHTDRSDRWTYYADEGWDAYGRDATVATRAGTASAGNECSRSDSWYSYNRQSSSTDSSYSYGDYTHLGDSSCGPQASSNIAGTPVNANAGNACTSFSQDSWNSWHNQQERSWSSSHQSASSCGTGAGGATEGASSWAGIVSGCRTGDSGNGRSSPNENDTSWSSSHAECSQGALLQGPDGMAFFLGKRDTHDANCNTGNCTSQDASLIGLQMDWQHDPLSPNPITAWYPLP